MDRDISIRIWSVLANCEDPTALAEFMILKTLVPDGERELRALERKAREVMSWSLWTVVKTKSPKQSTFLI